jgi:predicted DNA-binding transcriptional regulator
MTPAAAEILSAAIDASKLAAMKSTAVRVLVALLHLGEPGVTVRMSVADIASTAGVYHRSVRSAIEDLYRFGFIVRVKTRPREWAITIVRQQPG